MFNVNSSAMDTFLASHPPRPTPVQAERKPALSVLMTARNAEPFLADALNSILNQTFTDFELVVVDDASNDATPRTLERYAAADHRLRILRNGSRQGISKSANRGLEVCRAPVIARMDADDIAMPDRLEVQYAFFRESGAVAVGCYVEYMDRDGRRLTTIASPTDNADIQAGLLQGNCTLWHTGSMISAAALRQVGGYNERYQSAVDIELWLRLGEVGRLANQPRMLQRYRFYGTSVSAKRRDEQMDLCQQATIEAATRRGIAPQFKEKEHWRPGRDRASRHRFMLRLGWWAQRSGEYGTATLYARRALALHPASLEAWSLLRVAGRDRLARRVARRRRPIMLTEAVPQSSFAEASA